MQDHAESVYICRGCLTTVLGAQLNERRRKYSLTRRTLCCNEKPVWLPDASDMSFLSEKLAEEQAESLRQEMMAEHGGPSQMHRVWEPS